MPVLNLLPAIQAALRLAEPPTLTCTLRTRGNVVERIVGGKVVQTWKRRPKEATEDLFNRVMLEGVRSGQIAGVVASSRDGVALTVDDLAPEISV